MQADSPGWNDVYCPLPRLPGSMEADPSIQCAARGIYLRLITQAALMTSMPQKGNDKTRWACVVQLAHSKGGRNK
jgi:hypothetical protein